MTGPPTSLLKRRDCTSQRERTGGDGHDMQLFTASARPQIHFGLGKWLAH
jgi:hypothetical protein